MGKDLLIEIGCEEIPAGFIGPALEGGEKYLQEELSKKRVSFSGITITGSPRRLVYIVNDVSDSQEEKEEIVLGPPEKVAFDDSGKPTRAAEGFASSSGMKVEDLRVFDTERGKYVGFARKEKARPVSEIFPEVLTGLIPAIPFRKSMRWADLEERFARPIHWIISIFGDEVIDFTFGNVSSSNFTFGHRFLKPGRIEVNDISEYEAKLNEAFVIVDFEARKEIIRKQLKEVEEKIGYRWVKDESLLETVTNLVEYPVTVVGKFEESFLELPREILITTMKEHQKYFVFEDDEGALFPGFAAVSNMVTEDMDVIVRGNERVLRARLSDAEFYFKDDLKNPLFDKVEELKDVVYQSDLGTYYDKVKRVESLSKVLSEMIAPEKADMAARASLLSKADLVTGVVYEFPELQGIIGRDYATRTGEEKEVADAIFEHYLPRSASDILPSTTTGAIVSLADKLDTICGCFGVGLIPTGTQDPYALRRQAIGVINIVMEKRFDFSLPDLIRVSLKDLGDRLKSDAVDLEGEVMDFIRGRLSGILAAGDIDGEVVDAVLNAGFDNLLEAGARVEALSKFKDSDAYESLMTGFKRAQNITRGLTGDKEVNPDLFVHDEERELNEKVVEAGEAIRALARNKSYYEALERLAALKGPIDSFFDKVLVMDKDEKLKLNRLSLLSKLTGLFNWIADF